MKTAVKFLIALVLSLLLAWAVRTYVFTIFSVPQGGLPPQLKAGNRVIVNRIDYENFGRGDVVVFTPVTTGVNTALVACYDVPHKVVRAIQVGTQQNITMDVRFAVIPAV